MVLATSESLVWVALYLVAVLGLAVICAMKGKWVFAVLGLAAHLFAIVGAMRMAKPGSFWARRWYDEAQIAEAQRRFARKFVPRWGLDHDVHRGRQESLGRDEGRNPPPSSKPPLHSGRSDKPAASSEPALLRNPQDSDPLPEEDSQSQDRITRRALRRQRRRP